MKKVILYLILAALANCGNPNPSQPEEPNKESIPLKDCFTYSDYFLKLVTVDTNLNIQMNGIIISCQDNQILFICIDWEHLEKTYLTLIDVNSIIQVSTQENFQIQKGE